MGNLNSPDHIHTEARLAANKFSKDELHILRATWTDLAERNHGKGIDKETFKQYFPLDGLLGDRFFAQFNIKGSELIDLDEFLTGLSICSRGTVDEKIHFIFNMYDTSHDDTVSKEELTTLLNHVPKSVLGMNSMHESATHILDDADQTHRNNDCIQSDSSPTISGKAVQENVPTEFLRENGVKTAQDTTPIVVEDKDPNVVDAYTNRDIVEKAFQECDLNHDGRLKYEEFKMWVQRTPSILNYFDSILPFVVNKDHDDQSEKYSHSSAQKTKNFQIFRSRSAQFTQSSLKLLPRPFSATSRFRKCHESEFDSKAMPRSHSFQSGVCPTGNRRFTSSPSIDSGDHQSNDEAEEHCHTHLREALELTHSESVRQSLQRILDNNYKGFGSTSPIPTEDVHKGNILKKGYLWKRGNMLHMWNRRWYILSDNCLYYYAHKKDIRPRGVIFLPGCICEKVSDITSELKGYFGLELLRQDFCPGEHFKHEHRQLYCRSELERDEWLLKIQRAAQVVPIEEDYVIGEEIGRGRFSIVYECVHKLKGTKHAVKIIEKVNIKPEEKTLLRTEIAVLKLVNHPNIITLEGIYETKTNMYIVMELLSGGELFEKIVGSPRFSEEKAAKIIRPLLESVAYLHDLGIVHRDIKPENILCGDSLEDIKIADFGLSKMLLPQERMDTACGTLSYVAPEVLTMQGYGQEADMWSVGVILFLVLCGKLPFDGMSHDEIIRCTIQGELKISPAIWNSLSDDARLLVKELLHQNPKERITARAALKHPFITNHCSHHMSDEDCRDDSSIPSDMPSPSPCTRIPTDDSSSSTADVPPSF
mmetsp:Transcript_24409/g.35872  ORF Transcript_24409/g.35872 Transcript_24409/m.35872 type:complete len:819 (+) Transcript_24409:77-2533(+)